VGALIAAAPYFAPRMLLQKCVRGAMALWALAAAMVRLCMASAVDISSSASLIRACLLSFSFRNC
jgi:hypothetical protein